MRLTYTIKAEGTCGQLGYGDGRAISVASVVGAMPCCGEGGYSGHEPVGWFGSGPHTSFFVLQKTITFFLASSPPGLSG